LAVHDLTPVIYSLPDLSELDSFARRTGSPLRYHLKIDSGMGRLGTRAGAAEILSAIADARHARLEGLMTHFASSADYAGTQTDQQIQVFNGILGELQARGIVPAWVHMSSTNPVAYGRKAAWGNLVRVGHALYGYVSPVRGVAPRMILDVKPALSWKAAILSVKDVPEGTLIGYGGMFRAPRPMRIAIITAGYADGLPHRLSNRGKVIAAGDFAPILGAVSMDLTTIDISRAPALQPGDAVTLLGREGKVSLNAQQMARLAGTISYSVLCGINPRVKRFYV
jgi:alanine racemase